MSYKPGDLVLAKNIVFDDGHHDKVSKGRPCLVLFSKPKVINEKVVMCNYCLYMTDKKQYLTRPFRNKYIILDRKEDISLVYLSSVQLIENNDLEPLEINIGTEYLRIARNFADRNVSSRDSKIVSTLDELEKITDDIDAFTTTLKYRKHLFESLKKEEKKQANKFVKQDKIEKMFNRHKQLTYHRRKANLISEQSSLVY